MAKSVEIIMATVQQLVKPILDELHVNLEWVDVVQEKNRWLLRVFIDKQGGVGVNDCEQVSHQLAYLLDIEDLIPHRYTLEVSSPGLDRPLRTKDDLAKFRGRLINLSTRDPIDGKKQFIGRLVDFQDPEIHLETNQGRHLTIPWGTVAKARLEVEF